MNFIKRLAPCFHIKDTNIRILSEPSEFYQFLKERSNSSKKRIIISSLYLGTGDLETKLVENIFTSVTNNIKNNDFRVHLLFDSNRGSRPTNSSSEKIKSSRTMCLPLLGDVNKVKVSFYHTPNLRGYLHKILPNRVNEVVGLQHMKIYLFDDCLLLSGANLSADYFTNRQDRYIVFENSPELCDYFEELVNIVGSMSYRMTRSNELIPPQIGHDPLKGDFSAYVCEFRAAIEAFIERQIRGCQERERTSSGSEGDTQVYPLLQMGLYGVRQDQHVLGQLFALLAKNDPATSHSLAIASGYFNLDHGTERALINLANNGVPVEVLTAHPEANGFFDAAGSSGYIPTIYTAILQRFLSQTADDQSMRVREWRRPLWTFHGKGVWLAEGAMATATLVGSTNYGHRSCHRDLEAEVLLATRSIDLRARLTQERDHLFGRGTDCGAASRHVPFWLALLVPLLKHFL